MTTTPDRHDPTAALVRIEHGRWAGGVCAGLGRARGLPLGRLRAAFVLAALAGGLGVLVYIACWLIIPSEREELDRDGPRGIVVFAQACAGCAGLALLGGLAATATVFGFGWVVVAFVAAVFAGALMSWPRVGPAWVLLPIAAVALPSAAVAAGGVSLAPNMGHLSFAPDALGDAPPEGYRAGVGTMLVDLRQTQLPAGQSASLRVEGGVRRTIVALPHDRCLNVRLRYDIVPFAARVATLLNGGSDGPFSERSFDGPFSASRSDGPFSNVVLFGVDRHGGAGELSTVDRGGRGRTLTIDFTSEGGSLYVRDYPADVDPESQPDWPGYPVTLEGRPNTRGTPRPAARRLVRKWRSRHRVQVRSKRRIEALRPGPCSSPARR